MCDSARVGMLGCLDRCYAVGERRCVGGGVLGRDRWVHRLGPSVHPNLLPGRCTRCRGAPSSVADTQLLPAKPSPHTHRNTPHLLPGRCTRCRGAPSSVADTQLLPPEEVQMPTSEVAACGNTPGKGHCACSRSQPEGHGPPTLTTSNGPTSAPVCAPGPPGPARSCRWGAAGPGAYTPNTHP